MPMHAHFERYGYPVPHGKLPPFRFWVQQNLPSLYDDSLSYYDLLTRVTWYINQIVNTLKVYDDQFCEIMGVYNELEKYVNSYFDCLDVPEIVKTILDDMAATGKLSEIVIENIKDFSIDAKKIKYGIVPLHYTYAKTENGNEYYDREESDEDVVEILRHGSLVLGVFQGSPAYGTFALLQKAAAYIFQGQEVEFECGCVNTVYTRDFNITYDDFWLDDNGFIKHRVVTDYYTDDQAMLVLEGVYADIPDGYVTTNKIADKAVTEPKLADPVAAKLNVTYTLSKTGDQIKLTDSTGADCGTVTDSDTDTVFVLEDGSVTRDKLANGAVTWSKLYYETISALNPRGRYGRKYIFVADSYGDNSGDDSWVTWVARLGGLQEGVDYWKAALDGAGFTAGAKTFQQLFKECCDGLTDEQKRSITDIVLLGGWNDGSADITAGMSTFAGYVNEYTPYAICHMGYPSWEDSRVTGGNKLSRAAGREHYYIGATGCGFAWIENLEWVMHDYANFKSDGVHPNNNGAAEIGRAVLTHLRGGTVDMTRGFRVDQNVAWNTNVTPADNTKIVSTWMDNNICGMFTSHTDFNLTNAVTFTGHPGTGHPGDPAGAVGWYKLFDFGDKGFMEGSSFHGINAQYPVTLLHDGLYETVPCHLQIRNADGKAGLYLAPISTDDDNSVADNVYKPITNVTRIIFQVGQLTLSGWSQYA